MKDDPREDCCTQSCECNKKHWAKNGAREGRGGGQRPSAWRHGTSGSGGRRDLLRIILDDPDITAEAFVPTDARGFGALRRAQAEVQLVTATNALRTYEAGMPLILRVGKQLTWKDITEGLASGGLPRRDRTRTQAQVYQDILVRREELRSAERQQRLFKRYWGEARAQRRKAFSAWLLANGGEERTA